MNAVDLKNIIKRGAVEEIFTRALQEVAENIADINTPAEEKREIVLKFVFKPLDDRRNVAVLLSSQTKLQGFNSVKGSVYLGSPKPGDPVRMFSDDPRQDQLFAEADVETSAQ